MSSCSEKTLIAASMIFGGLTFLLPSLVTIYTYVTKWIPEEPDPAKRAQMTAILIGSAVTGLVIVGGGVYYLQAEKCL
ncbi:hypothetical protein MUP77_17405 [Candidatus Bathyarchaeota archaeon]|nr:hypothetical protein [Candidatus Bathyarchaeota archaeon]